MQRVVVGAVVVVLTAGSACFPVDPPPKPPIDDTGSIAGTITNVDRSGGVSVHADPARAARNEVANVGRPARPPLVVTGSRREARPDPVEFRPGDALVLFERKAFEKATLAPVLERMKSAAGFGDVDVVVDSCKFRVVCKLSLRDEKGPLDEERTLSFIERMTALKEPHIKLFADNRRHHGFVTPNDPLFPAQWHYNSIKLPAAWDLTVGDPELVVAVVDSGVRHANPDLRDKLARDPQNANQFVEFDFVTGADLEDDDIAGIDLDAEDPGDNLFGTDAGEDSFHGTHVMGTIGAETNNTRGVAGVLWEAQLVPVRVLGDGLAGNFDDILNGLAWAIGDTDPQFDIGQVINKRPARVVNLSLGAPDAGGSATAIWTDVVTEIVDDPDNFVPNDVVLVCAAGNAGQDARGTTPANVERIITVGAVRFDGQRADYSNFGSPIDVMAPGGQTGQDLDQNGSDDMILSTWDVDVKLEQGTSMASPHVAGVAGLLLAAKPSLNHDQVHDLLKGTADQRFRCNEGCGNGIIDAAQALIVAGAVTDPAPRLSVDSQRVSFPTGIVRQSLRVLNLGNVAAPFDVSFGAGDAELFTVTPTTGTLARGETVELTINLARGGETKGAVELKITGTGAADGQEIIVVVSFDDVAPRPDATLDTVEVSAFFRNADGNLVAAEKTQALRENGFAYKIEGLGAGVYEVYGVGDNNHDGIFDSQIESFGAFGSVEVPTPVVLEANDTAIDAIDFSVALRSGFTLEQGVGAECTPETSEDDCAGIDFAPERDCVGGFPQGYCSRDCTADGLCGLNGKCDGPLDCDGTACFICFQTCVSSDQCREGYECDRFGTCTPIGFN